MNKIKITSKKTNKVSFVTQSELDTIKSNPLVANKFKFEEVSKEPSEPVQKTNGEAEAKGSSPKPKSKN